MRHVTTETYLKYLNYSDVEIIKEMDMLIEKISISKMTNSFQKSKSHIKKTLKEYGVSYNNIEKLGKNKNKQLQGYFEEGKTPEEVTKLIINDTVKSLKPVVKNIIAKLSVKHPEEREIFKKILISLLMYVIIGFISGVITGFLMATGTGLIVISLISIIIVAPLLEEAVKNYFIKKDMPWIGTGVVFGIELIKYVMALTAAGMSLPKVIILRLITLCMHFTTTLIQKYIMEKDPGNTKYAYIAFITGVAIHMTWNIFSLIYNNEILSIIK